MAAAPLGFETPVCQAVLWKRLLVGAPKPVTLFVLMMAGIAVIWNWWAMLLPLALLQGAAGVGTWLDEDWFEVGSRALGIQRHYEA